MSESVVPFAGSRVEARTVELTTAVALLVDQVRLEVPGLPLVRVRRCVDAALALTYAADRVLDAVCAEELAAEGRAVLPSEQGEGR